MKRLFILGLGIALLGGGLVFGDISGTLDQSCPIVTATTVIGGPGGYTEVAQTFTVGLEGKLSCVTLNGLALRDGSNPVYVSIRPVVSGVPDDDDDNILATATVPNSSLPTTPYGSVTVDFTAHDIQVEEGDVLAWSLDSNGNEMNTRQSTSSQPDQYTGGRLFKRTSTYSFASFATSTSDWTRDYSFATYVLTDTTPPEVTCAEMDILWPANHDYVTYSLSDLVESVIDETDGELDVDELGKIVSIASDEPEDAKGGGDGNTTDDIVILDDTTFKVRAERMGSGNGRVYSITFEIADAAGNVATATCTVGVPKSQNGNAPVDDGAEAGYSVP
jgi:hypothetical protein